MANALQEQARQSGLFLSDKTAKWNEKDWPPLEGGWRSHHVSILLNHPDYEDNINDKAQTVVVLGGSQRRQCVVDTNSVLLLNLEEPRKRWRRGPPMNKIRHRHAAVVCNGGVYVVGGWTNEIFNSDCIERIDVKDLLHSRRSSKKWTILNCRLSTPRYGCSAVEVHNRYIVVMGGSTDLSSDRESSYLSSVEIFDTSNDTVSAGPRMTVPRAFCGSTVVGEHRIFVVGGCRLHCNLDSVEYWDFVQPADDRRSRIPSSSSAWTTHSDLALSVKMEATAVVAVGFCLAVMGGLIPTVEILDTYRSRVFKLPSPAEFCFDYSLVTAANQIAVVGGYKDPSCATLSLMDRNTWLFRRLCQQPTGWYHRRKGMVIRNVKAKRRSSSRSTRKRARANKGNR